MKEIEKEKLVNATMIRSLALLAVVVGIYLVDNGYQRLGILEHMPTIMLFLGAAFFIITIAFTWLASNKKSSSIYNYAAYFGFLAVATILLKVNYETYALEFTLSFINRPITVKFAALLNLLIAIYIPTSLVYVVYKITRKNKVQRV